MMAVDLWPRDSRALITGRGLVGALVFLACSAGPPASGQEAAFLLDRRAILDQALTDYQAGRPEVARQRLRGLLPSSPTAEDEAFVLSIHDDIRRAHPVSLGGGLVLAPSSNVNRVSKNDRLETLIGTVMLTEGGRPQFGVTANLSAELRRGLVLGPGRDLNLRATLDRNLHPDPLMQRSDLTLAVGSESFSARGSWGLEAGATAGRYDLAAPAEPRLDFNQVFLAGHVSRNLPGLCSVMLQGRIDHTVHPGRQLLSGDSAVVAVSYRSPSPEGGELELGLRLSRTVTRAEPHVHSAAMARIGYSLPVGASTRLGLQVEFGGAVYDNPFTLMPFARRDGLARVGFSIVDARLQILGRVPHLSCNLTESRSNVALFASQSTDCQIGLDIAF